MRSLMVGNQVAQTSSKSGKLTTNLSFILPASLFFWLEFPLERIYTDDSKILGRPQKRLLSKSTKWGVLNNTAAINDHLKG